VYFPPGFSARKNGSRNFSNMRMRIKKEIKTAIGCQHLRLSGRLGQLDGHPVKRHETAVHGFLTDPNGETRSQYV
jgi:hypothetical protein